MRRAPFTPRRRAEAFQRRALGATRQTRRLTSPAPDVGTSSATKGHSAMTSPVSTSTALYWKPGASLRRSTWTRVLAPTSSETSCWVRSRRSACCAVSSAGARCCAAISRFSICALSPVSGALTAMIPVVIRSASMAPLPGARGPSFVSPPRFVVLLAATSPPTPLSGPTDAKSGRQPFVHQIADRREAASGLGQLRRSPFLKFSETLVDDPAKKAWRFLPTRQFFPPSRLFVAWRRADDGAKVPRPISQRGQCP